MMGARGEPAAPVNLGVAIDGSGEAGTVHTVDLTYDDPQPYPPPQRTIQWKRDGVDILGATSASYTPVDTYALTVTVSVSNDSGSAGPVTSAAVNLTPGYTTDPVITTATTFEIGEALTVSTPATIGQVSAVTYRWKRDGTQIATGNTYTTTADDEGHELTAEVLIQGANGITVAIADPVFVFFPVPTVTITDITNGGFTDISTFTVTFDTTGEIVSTVIIWYSDSDPNTILATGNNVSFSSAVSDLKASVTVRNPSDIAAVAISDETAVVAQAEAPEITSLTIDKGGTSVDAGTTLNLVLSTTGSPAPSITAIQWEDNGSPISGATGASYVVQAGDVGPITVDVTVSNGVSPDDTATSSNSVAINFSTSPNLAGIPDLDLALGAGDYTLGLSAYGSNLTGVAYSLDLEELVASDSLSGYTAGNWVFIDYKKYFAGASQWTATGTSQSTNPFSGTPAALPTGWANSEQPGVLRGANTLTDGGYTVKVWGGDGTSAVSATLTITIGEVASATVPPAPPDGNWLLEDNGDGQLRIVVVSPFPNGGSANTDREYEVDDSGTWVSFGVTGNGTFFIPAASLVLNQSASVKLRATNAIGVGAESNPKTAIPTAPSDLQLTVSDDFATWAGTAGLASLTTSDDFATWSAA